VVTFARLFTGFDRRPERGNTNAKASFIDGMALKPAWRDRFPKTKLDSGYLGDGYPLCQDLPPKGFLAKGARYQNTGASSVEGSALDGSANWAVLRGRFTPSKTSALHRYLCRRDATTGRCAFDIDEIELDQDLVCEGVECSVEFLRVVKIVDGDATRYFTYVPPPCVRLAVFKGVRTEYGDTSQCANPLMFAAGPVCCKPNTTTVTSKYGPECLFAAEYTTHATAKQRCAAQGAELCSTLNKFQTSARHTCSSNQFTWSNQPCDIKVEVHANGFVGLVDASEGSDAIYNSAAVNRRFTAQSLNTFKVHWGTKDGFPTLSVGCGSGCVATAHDSCMCEMSVAMTVPFTDASSIPGRADIESTLFIGAPDPTTFGAGVYTLCTNAACKSKGEVRVYTKVGSGSGKFDASTVFELPSRRAGGLGLQFFNRVSTVRVGSAGATFRNPPAFLPLVGESTMGRSWQSDELDLSAVEAETQAHLDHLSEHDNTAPFVVYRLIQRLVTSNPSPRYMRAAVAAFRTGTYAGKIFSGR
jgi:cullin-associated NEDD8-dissociated protein 1